MPFFVGKPHEKERRTGMTHARFGYSRENREEAEAGRRQKRLNQKKTDQSAAKT